MLTARLFFILISFVLICPPLVVAGKGAVLLSREIAPYISMVEGLEKQLRKHSIDRFFLDRHGKTYSLGEGAGSLDSERYDVLIAVGPAALEHLQTRTNGAPLVFGMVLNPLKIIQDQHAPICGVSLNIPVEEQFVEILRHFKWLKRLGILFDPANNQDWFDRAVAIAEPMELTLVPLQVQRISDQLKIVGDFTQPQALLFIPDKTIISKAVIHYVIKQAVLQKTPVIGYNQFFHDSGATLDFILDYEEIGKQVGRQVSTVLNAGACEGLIAPAFDTKTNENAWRALQLDRKRAGP